MVLPPVNNKSKTMPVSALPIATQKILAPILKTTTESPIEKPAVTTKVITPTVTTPTVTTSVTAPSTIATKKVVPIAVISPVLTAEDRAIMEKAKEAPKVLTAAGATAWAKQQLGIETKAPEAISEESKKAAVSSAISRGDIVGALKIAETPTIPVAPIPAPTRKSVSAEILGDRAFNVYRVTTASGESYFTVEEKGKTVPGYEKLSTDTGISSSLYTLVTGKTYGETKPVGETVEYDITKLAGGKELTTTIRDSGKPYIPPELKAAIDDGKLSTATTGIYVPDKPEIREGTTATPEYLGAATTIVPGKELTPEQQHFQEKVESYVEAEKPHLTVMALEKQYYVGESSSGEPLYTSMSPSQVLHGFNPAKEDYTQSNLYSQIESDIKSGKEIVIGNINIATEAGKNIPIAEDYINQIKTALTDINKAGDNDKIFLIEGGEEKQYSKQEAIAKLSESLEKNYEYLDWAKSTSSKLSEFQSASGEIANQEFMVGKYKELGYKVKSTDDGYMFELPTSTEVYQWKHGEWTGTALSAAAFMESPLAIKTLGSAVQEWVTGEHKTGEQRLEELSSYALGLDVAIKEGKYLGAVISSPAMIEGVYTPLVALGATSLISEGISIVAPRITAGLETIGSKFTPTGQAILGEVKSVGKTVAEPFIEAGKVAAKYTGTQLGSQSLNWSLFGALEGGKLIEVAVTEPERFGGELAESAFGWGLTTAAMGEGFEGLPERMPKGKFIEQDIAQMKLEAELGFKTDVKALPVDIRSTSLYVQVPLEKEGASQFVGRETVIAKAPGQKPRIFTVEVKGTGQQYPEIMRVDEIPKDISTADARAMIKWTEKTKFGTKMEHVRFEDISSSSVLGAERGEEKLFYSIGEAKHGVDLTRTEPISVVKKIGVVEGEKRAATVYGMGAKAEQVDIMRATVSDVKARGTIVVIGEKESKTLEKIGEEGAGDISVVKSLSGKTQAGVEVKLITKEEAGMKPLDFGEVSGQIAETISKEVTKVTTKAVPTTGVTTAASAFAYEGINIGKAIGKSIYTVTAKELAKAEEKEIGWKDTGRLVGIEVPVEMQKPSERTRIDKLLGTTTLTIEKTGEELQPDLHVGGVTITPTKETEKQEPDVGTGVDVIPGIREEVSQDVGLKLEQAQAQMLKMDELGLVITTNVPVDVIPSVPRVPTYFRRKKKDEEEEERKPVGKKKKKTMFLPEKHAAKEIMADIVSVMRSQARYGKATHPRLTKKTYEEAARTGFRHVPTLELKGVKQFTPRVKSNGLSLNANELRVGNKETKISVRRRNRNVLKKQKWI